MAVDKKSRGSTLRFVVLHGLARAGHPGRSGAGAARGRVRGHLLDGRRLAMDWRLVTEFFASVGYGLLSAFIPVFNAEVYIVAAQALGLTAEVTAALGVAVGQTIGKTAIVLGLRHGTRLGFPAAPHHPAAGARGGEARPGPTRPDPIWPTDAGRTRLLALIGHSRWGSAIIFMSGATGLPPVFAVQFLVPATKMPAWLFAVALFLGRCVLFLAVAFGASAIIARLFS